MQNENADETEEERITREVKEESVRELYIPEEHRIDFGKVRPTEVKSNQRVLMPKPGNEKQEAELKCRKVLTERTRLC